MPEEVEQVLFSKPHVRRAERGRVKGAHLYVAYGQTEAGRFLVVFFIRKRAGAAMPIAARQMTEAERRYFHAQEKSHRSASRRVCELRRRSAVLGEP
jgi:uncharacterized DUF497 family protein